MQGLLWWKMVTISAALRKAERVRICYNQEMQSNKHDKDRLFSQLYEALSKKVFRYIYFRTHDKEIANDITQSVFLRAYQKIERLRPGEEASYIMTIARNALIDYYRSRKITIEYDEAVPSVNPFIPQDDSPEDIHKSKEDVIFIEKIIQSLPETDQEIVRLHAILEWSYPEISKHLKLKEEAVRKRYSRALGNIREIIIKLYPDYE